MAKRRDIKALIHNTTTELLFLSLIQAEAAPEGDQERFYEHVKRISGLHDEFIARVNHPNGTHDHKIVRAYFRRLLNDFDTQIDLIIKDLQLE
ncbi:MAG: hypothetical protein LBS16_07385 [Prevotellaceae bacterium]|jgi:hypothetical protein|nr:hypothetical protein [Prevotellaceae bacterium]